MACQQKTGYEKRSIRLIGRSKDRASFDALFILKGETDGKSAY